MKGEGGWKREKERIEELCERMRTCITDEKNVTENERKREIELIYARQKE